MRGAVPERYMALSLNTLDTYFAMARGYQGANGDVKALAMKKWFNTNYHYIVPEVDSGTVFKCTASASKPVAEYKEALALGIQTVPSLIGPYTLLHLTHFNDGKSRADFTEQIVKSYADVVAELSKVGAQWVSLAEPALVLDMSADDRKYFTELYSALLNKIRGSSKIKVLLQTYFGDVRDCYSEVSALGFDGIGLDFVEGVESLSLVKKSFPKNAILFAGVLCGKNIWRSEYEKKINLLKEIESSVPAERIVASTSCSLLHVPYTTTSETKLNADVLKHFSFAEEKLTELNEIAACFDGKKSVEENKKLFAQERTKSNVDVRNAVNKLSEKDFERKPSFEEREKIQK